MAEEPTSLSCPSANTTVTNQGNWIDLDFTAPDTCNFVVTADVGGTIITMTGTASWDGATISTTNLVVSGGAFGPPPTTGPTAQDKSNIVAGLQSTLNSATPGLLDGGGIPTNGNGNTNGSGLTFAPNSLGFSPRVDTNDLFTRRFGFADQPQGIMGLAEQRSGKGFNFSVDMQQMLARARKREAEEAAGYREGGAKDPYAASPRSRWNAWVSGRYVDFDDDQANADRSGDLWWVVSGLSYRLGEHTTVGAFSRYREGEVNSTALNATLDADYMGGGVFLATTSAGGLRIVGAALFEQGDSDISIAGATGQFDTDQVTLEASIDKRFQRGRFWIEPGVSVLYTESDNDDYTDSSGTFVIGQDLTLGRLTYGPTIGTTIDHGSVAIKPFAKVNGIWDFENDGNFATSTGAVFSSGETAINLGGGVEVVYATGITLKLAGDWFAFDTDLEGWALTAGFGAPLSAFGLGNVAPGFVSLDFAGREDDASATARLRIPLGKAE